MSGAKKAAVWYHCGDPETYIARRALQDASNDGGERARAKQEKGDAHRKHLDEH